MDDMKTRVTHPLFEEARNQRLMRILKSKFDLVDFFTRVARAEARALLLDYDGTLAPFNIARNESFPYPGIVEPLQSLHDTRHTRLILVSGRLIKDLLPLIQLKPQPEIWGSHGYERLLPDGRYETEKLNPQALQDLANAYTWIEEMGLAARCEKKLASLAIHWRGLPQKDIETIRAQILRNWSPLVPKTRFRVCEFDGGIELYVTQRNKGYAVKTVLSELGANAAAAYLGDDFTDEDAFKAMQGKGLSVLVREKYRSTAADLWLKPPQELLEFLICWKESAEAEHGFS
jgi:trehalose-phosphatase